MAEDSIYDLVVEELLARQSLVRGELKDRFRKTKPFRQEEVSPKETLVEYDEMTPEDIQRMRGEFGDEAVDIYLNNIGKVQRRYE